MSRISFTSLVIALSCAALGVAGCSGGTKGAGNPPGSDGGPGIDGGMSQDCTVAGCAATYQCNPTTKTCEPDTGPCASATPLPDCGKTCLRQADCASPTYCDHNICTAQCDPSSSTNYCGAGMICAQNGQCVTGTTSDGGTIDTDACAPTQVTANPVVPTVVLIVDQSGSMNNNYGGGFTRWGAVADALTGTSGVVTQLQNVVRFGALFFSTKNGTCPFETKITPALNNFTPINTVFTTQGPLQYTPTGAAITDTTAWLRSQQPQVPATGNITWDGNPVIYVLATDGEPNGCSTNVSTSVAEQAVYDAVTAAYGDGIDTYVISVAVNNTTQAFLNQVAMDGGTNCDPTGGNAACPANNPTDLATAIDNIVKNQISCDIALNGTIQNTSTVCTDGHVQLTVAGGSPIDLNCQGDCATATGDGWCDIDASNIRLIGSACQTLQGGQSVSLTATFACGAFQGH